MIDAWGVDRSDLDVAKKDGDRRRAAGRAAGGTAAAVPGAAVGAAGGGTLGAAGILHAAPSTRDYPFAYGERKAAKAIGQHSGPAFRGRGLFLGTTLGAAALGGTAGGYSGFKGGQGIVGHFQRKKKKP